MPDHLPPSWGHEPDDGRDLDALLSGEALRPGRAAGLPDTLRPVAGALAALRAAPAWSELSGEAAARAAFRAFAGPAEYRPAGHGPAGYEPAGYEPAGYEPAGYEPAGYEPAGYEPAGFGPSGYEPADDEPRWNPGFLNDADEWHTLVLPLPLSPAAAGHEPRQPDARRHRHRHRRATGSRRWLGMAVLGSAAAVAAVGVAALAGTFSGSAVHQGPSGSNPAVAQPSTAPGGSVTKSAGVLGTATAVPTVRAKPKASPGSGGTPGTAPQPAALCHELFTFPYPLPPEDQAKAREDFSELSELAGSSSIPKVFTYCAGELGRQPWAATPGVTPSSPPPPGFGFPGGDGSGGPADSTRSGHDGSSQRGSGPGSGGSGSWSGR